MLYNVLRLNIIVKEKFWNPVVDDFFRRTSSIRRPKVHFNQGPRWINCWTHCWAGRGNWRAPGRNRLYNNTMSAWSQSHTANERMKKTKTRGAARLRNIKCHGWHQTLLANREQQTFCQTKNRTQLVKQITSLYHFNIIEDPLCECGEGIEAVKHYLFELRKYEREREVPMKGVGVQGSYQRIIDSEHSLRVLHWEWVLLLWRDFLNHRTGRRKLKLPHCGFGNQ